MPMAASMSPPPTASIWSATPMRPCPIPAAPERHLWQYPDPGHQSAVRPADRPGHGAGSASERRLARGPDRHARPDAGRPGPGAGQFRAADAQQAFNAQSNANAAFPPPTSLTGRDTGLLSDRRAEFHRRHHHRGHRFQRQSGRRASMWISTPARLSVDGGAAASIGTTVGSFTTALNTALGANGSASFTNGQLSICRHRQQWRCGAGRRHRSRPRAAARPSRNSSA